MAITPLNAPLNAPLSPVTNMYVNEVKQYCPCLILGWVINIFYHLVNPVLLAFNDPTLVECGKCEEASSLSPNGG